MSFAVDPLLAFRTFFANDVRFVVIGDLAGHVWGSPVITSVLDICHDPSTVNCEALASALNDLQAKPRIEGRALETDASLFINTSAGSLHCVGVPSGTTGYDDLLTNAAEFEVDGIRVMVASVEDLMRMFRATNSARDRVAAEILISLR